MNHDTQIRHVELRQREYEITLQIEKDQYRLLEKHGQTYQLDDICNDRLVRGMYLKVWGIDHPKRHVIRYPADWWQAVKERFAPAWFLDRYPVVFTEVTASLEETYPDFQPALPDRREVVRFAVAETKRSNYAWR